MANITQRIIWTALPNGVADNGNLRLSVFISPRLESDQLNSTLALFSDFLDWPQALASATISVSQGDDHFVMPTKITSPTPNSAYWNLLFPQDTPVCAYPSPVDPAQIQTYSVGDTYQALKEIYQHEASQSIPVWAVLFGVFKDEPKAPSPLPPNEVWDEELLVFLGKMGSQLGIVGPGQLPDQDLTIIARQFTAIATQVFEHNQGSYFDKALRAWLAILADRYPVLRDYFGALVAGKEPATETIGGNDVVAQRLRGRYLTYIGDPVAQFYAGLSPITEQQKNQVIDAHNAAQHDPCQFDFHAIVGTLGQYPYILRLLGLVLDLEFTPGDLHFPAKKSKSYETPGKLQVKVEKSDWKTKTTFAITPLTHARQTVADTRIVRFEHVATSTEFINGFLNISAANQFSIISADVDGAAMKANQLGQTLNQAASQTAGQITNSPSSTDAMSANAPQLRTPADMPALRTAGIGLVRIGRLESLKAVLSVAKKNNEDLSQRGQPPELFLDDLIRGFRVYVLDETTSVSGKWRSLVARRGSYTFLSADGKPVQHAADHDDEGWIVPAITTPTFADGQPHLHESVFKWEGWSLAVSRPGKPVSGDENETPAELTLPNSPHIRLDFRAQIVKNSLPKLRFGRKYRLRVGVVDLAGNPQELPVDGVNPTTDSAPIVFRRFEPLPAPTLILSQPIDTSHALGSSANRMVIRSENSDAPHDTVPTLATDDRYFAPPPSSQFMAELHGMFDQVIGTNATSDEIAATFSQILNKDKGQYQKVASDAVAQGHLYQLQINKDKPTETPQYIILLDMPYLPDPAVDGVSFTSLPGTPNEQIGSVQNGVLNYRQVYSDLIGDSHVSVTQIGYYSNASSQWPDAQPFLLHVVEGAAETQWDELRRTLTVFLPKAHTATIQVSSWGQTSDHGLLDWFLETNPDPASRQQMLDSLAFGLHPSITPARQLTLIHAVQQPIGKPRIQQLVVTATANQTAVTLDAEFWTHALSTEKLDLSANWMEKNDVGTFDSEENVPHVRFDAHVLEQRVLLESSNPTGNADPDVQYNYVSENASLRRRNVSHECGDTKYRHVQYQLTATSRFGEFFPTTDITRRSEEPFPLDIPNRAIPIVPQIALIIPTFRWGRTTQQNTTSSERICGLRIYVQRPWFATGDGELLGLIVSALHDGKEGYQFVVDTPDPTQWLERDPRISHWGSDPIWKTAEVRKLQAEDITGPLPIVTAQWDNTRPLLVNEITDAPNSARVVCFAPAYDSDRQQWYVDLEFVNQDLYFPFIRFGLVRYQPVSTANEHFSEVVVSDFTQIPPYRRLSRTFTSATTAEIILTGPASLGRIKTDGTKLVATSRVQVHLETRNSQITDPVLGWEPVQNSSMNLSPEADLLPQTLDQPLRTSQQIWKSVLFVSPEVTHDQARLVVEEFEQYDPASTSSDPAAADAFPTERLVYTDVIPMKV